MRCAVCNKVINIGEEYYFINGDNVCLDCIDEYLDEWCKEGDKYVIGDDEISDEYELDDYLFDHKEECDEQEDEWGDPRIEPEYWEDR